jgi:hypothetical protein
MFQLLNKKSMFAALHLDIISQVWLPSFNRPALWVEQQKSKMELGTKFLRTVSLTDTLACQLTKKVNNGG